MPEAEPGQSLIGTVLGGFRLVEKLGEGGMGAVYKGYDESLDRHVAVKILPQALAADETYVQRFMREARSVAKLHHPNLVHIYAVGEEHSLHYFAMEMISGEPLSVRIAREGGLKVIDAVRFIGQTMSALDKVHALGIVHRDIKSANIMINPDGRAILMDFGLAKGGDYAEGVTTAGIVLGTPEYMSPEQAFGEEVTAQSDVYSLGVLFFETLTGRLPFTGKSAIAVIRQHTEADPPVPSSAKEGIPKPLDEIVLRAMAKKRSVRYANLQQMAAALLRVGRTRELLELAGEAAAETMAVKVPKKTMERKPHVPSQATAPTIVDDTPPPAGIATGAPTIADDLSARPSAPARGGGSATAIIIGVAAAAAAALFFVILYAFRPGDGIPPQPKPPNGRTGDVVIEGEEPFRGRLVLIEDGVAVFEKEDGERVEVGFDKRWEMKYDAPAEGEAPEGAPPEGGGTE